MSAVIATLNYRLARYRFALLFGVVMVAVLSLGLAGCRTQPAYVGLVAPVADRQAVAVAVADPGTSSPAATTTAPDAAIDTDASTLVPLPRDVVEQMTRASRSAPLLVGAATTDPGVYYANCAAVRAAGKAPILRGADGYRDGLDSDSDGIGCEDTAAVVVAAADPVHEDYYANCAEVRAAGVAPLARGDHGYRAALDADNDGFACDVAAGSNGGVKPTADPRDEDPTETAEPTTDPTDIEQNADQTDDEQHEREQEKAAGRANDGNPPFFPASQSAKDDNRDPHDPTDLD